MSSPAAAPDRAPAPGVVTPGPAEAPGVAPAGPAQAPGVDPAGPAPASDLAPPAVRRAALGLPIGALLLGYLLPGRREATAAVRAGALALPAGAIVLARLGARGSGATADRRDGSQHCAPGDPRALADPGDLRRRPGGRPTADRANVTLVVPARNEAAVIGRLVADVAAVRSDPMALVVIDDASSDRTADIAADAIKAHGLADVASVVRLSAPSGSKAAALGRVPVTSGAVVVLDADARVTPGFVDAVREALAAEGVAQARRRMLRPAGRGPGSWFARGLALVQDGEQAVDDRIARARLVLGGAAEFRGDGMCLQATALADLGGWPDDALCEDLELSSRWYLQMGRGVARPACVEVWEQPVLSLRSLLAQRLRWAEGSVRRDLRIVLPAVWRGPASARRRCEAGGYASQALVPWAVMGLALRAGAGWRGRAVDGASPAGRSRPPGRHDPAREAARTLASIGAGYAAAAVVLTWSALGDGLPAPSPAAAALPHRGYAPVPRLLRALGVAAFTAHWPLVLLAAWVRVALRPGTPTFVPTGHEPPEDFSDPEPPRPRRT